MLRRSSLILGFASMLAACGGGAGAVGASGDDITGGTRDKGDGAVEMVSGGPFCSGVLILPDVVLTAGHCVKGATGLRFGRHVGTEIVVDFAVAAAAYPSHGEGASWYDEPDVALLLLQTPMPITPLRGGTPPAVGATCRAVGFGPHLLPNGQADLWQRYSAHVKVDAMHKHYFDTVKVDGYPSPGDSGGALICSGNILRGIVSDGGAAGHTGFSRLDGAALGWIHATLRAWGRTAPNWSTP
jgi:hypothetical protein